MTVAALVPLLVEDKFGAGRPPFGSKFFLRELPVVALVGNMEGEVVLAAPFTNLCLVAASCCGVAALGCQRRKKSAVWGSCCVLSGPNPKSKFLSFIAAASPTARLPACR